MSKDRHHGLTKNIEFQHDNTRPHVAEYVKSYPKTQRIHNNSPSTVFSVYT